MPEISTVHLLTIIYQPTHHFWAFTILLYGCRFLLQDKLQTNKLANIHSQAFVAIATSSGEIQTFYYARFFPLKILSLSNLVHCCTIFLCCQDAGSSQKPKYEEQRSSSWVTNYFKLVLATFCGYIANKSSHYIAVHCKKLHCRERFE